MTASKESDSLTGLFEPTMDWVSVAENPVAWARLPPASHPTAPIRRSFGFDVLMEADGVVLAFIPLLVELDVSNVVV